MRTTTSASNLINGVSQQPAVLRLPSQAEEQINFYPSPIQGLTRRNPTEHISSLGSDTSEAFIHWINRDSDERYAVVLQDGVSTPAIRVFGLDGTEYPVHGPASPYTPDYAYLGPNGVPFDKSLYRAVTVADYTFLVNRSRTVQVDNTKLDDTDSVAGRAYVQVIQGNYESKYQVTLGLESGPEEQEVYQVSTWDGDDTNLDNDASQSRWKVWFGAVYTAGEWHLGTEGENWTLDYNKTASTTDSTTVAAPAPLAGNGVPWQGGQTLATWLSDFAEQFVDDINGNGALKVTNFKTYANTVYFEILGTKNGSFNVSPSWGALPSGDKQQSLTEIAENTAAKLKSIATQDIATEFAKRINQGSSIYYAKAFGSTIQVISKTYPMDRVEVEDSFGDGGMRAVNRKAQTFADLPSIAKNNYAVLVEGDPAAGEDDYWVRFKTNDTGATATGAQGLWEESRPKYPSTTTGVTSRAFLELNMPHVLIRKQDDGAGTVTGTPNQIYFSFEEGGWDKRDVGDDNTNPKPSFVDQKIEDLFFYKNRLGFISGDRVIMSEAGRYFNFWRTTVRSLLDSDPIDVTASHIKAVTLKHAVPSQDNLVLFSDRAQLALSADQLLSPKTVAIDPVSDFEVALSVRPINLETSILFARKRGQYSSMVQFFRQDEVSYNGQDLTQSIPSYILGDVDALTFSESEKVVAVVTSGGEALYLFNFITRGNEYVQSAWHKFHLGSGQIRSAEFYGDTLYLVVERSEGFFLEKMSVSTSAVDAGQDFQVRIDRRINNAGAVYDSDTQLTTLTLPYDIDGTPAVSTADGQYVPVVANPTPTTLTLNGDWTGGTLWVGEEYESRYTFSTVTLKRPGPGGQELVLGEHIQLLSGKLVYENSGYFKTEVTPYLRDTISQEFVGPILATQEQGPLLKDGVFKFSIMGKNQDTTIAVSSTSPLPCSLLTAEWTLSYYSR